MSDTISQLLRKLRSLHDGTRRARCLRDVFTWEVAAKTTHWLIVTVIPSRSSALPREHTRVGERETTPVPIRIAHFHLRCTIYLLISLHHRNRCFHTRKHTNWTCMRNSRRSRRKRFEPRVPVKIYWRAACAATGFRLTSRGVPSIVHLRGW